MLNTNLDYNCLDDSYFLSIANILLNESYLKVNEKIYRLVEIEFYLKCKSHIDPYTHGDPDQLLMHTFYFHKFKTSTYKSGTFKGMDLTYGNADEEAYFGILIRAIEDMDTKEIIEGPCNVVNRILLEYDVESIMDLTNGENLNIFENNKNFILCESNNLSKRKLFAGPRIGLSAKYPEFQNKLYRFVAGENKIKKKKTTLVEV